jgi:hypothetical protein
MTIAGLMVLQEFGRDSSHLAAAGIVGLAFGFGGQYHQRYYFCLLLFLKINTDW